MATAAKVIAAEVACVNSVQTIVSNTFAVANTSANGTAFRVSIAGVSPPGQVNVQGIAPGVVLSLLVGSNGNLADPVILSTGIPAQPGGQFAAEYLVTLRANGAGIGSAGANANTVWTAACLTPNPFYGYGQALQTLVAIAAPSSNGAPANVVITSNAVFCNITVAAQAASGVNAVSLIETSVISQVV